MSELTDQEREQLLNEFKTNNSPNVVIQGAIKSKENPGVTLSRVMPPGPGEATLRGIGSGVTGGFQPQVAGALSAINPFTTETYSQGRDLAAARNDAAFKEHPYAYGGGYAGGAVGLGLLTGGLGEIAPAAEALPLLDNASKLARAKNFVEPARRIMNTQVLPKIPGATLGTTIQGVGGATGAATNEKPIWQPSGNQPSVNMNATPLSQTENSTNQFATLLNYLKQANNSSNPDVQQAAQQAQAAIGDGTDEDAKRKSAMALLSTQQGRAVGNSDSPLNDVA